MKKNYVVEITETLQRQVSVKASSYEEAYEIVKRAYKNEDIVLDCDDFVSGDVNVTVAPVEAIAHTAGTVVLEDNKYLLVENTEVGYKWLLGSDSVWSQKGEIVSDVGTIEKMLPVLFEQLKIKEKDIIAKYNGDVTYELMHAKEMDNDDE